MDNQTKNLITGFIVGAFWGAIMCGVFAKSHNVYVEKKMFEFACSPSPVFHHDQYKNMVMCSDGRAFSLSVSATQTRGVQ